MNEKEFLVYCQSQVSGTLKEDDLVLMLTAWGQIQYQLGYNAAVDHSGQDKSTTTETGD